MSGLWAWANTSLGSNVVGGLIVALVLALLALFPRVRHPLFAAIVKGARFVVTIRLSTTTRQRGVVEAAYERARVDVEAARTSTQRKFFVHARWFVGFKKDGDGKSYVLGNVAEGSVATNVHLDAGTDFGFMSSADWPRIPGGRQVDFRGRASQDAFAYEKVVFNVTWSDDHGDQHTRQVECPLPYMSTY